jgi:hypothetical protein
MGPYLPVCFRSKVGTGKKIGLATSNKRLNEMNKVLGKCKRHVRDSTAKKYFRVGKPILVSRVQVVGLGSKE